MPAWITSSSTCITSTPAINPASADHADLVARLVAEAFEEGLRPARQATALPSAPAGLTTALPGAEVVLALSSPPAPGGVPPVHPSSQPAAPRLAPHEATPSGGHVADSQDTHAFG